MINVTKLLMELLVSQCATLFAAGVNMGLANKTSTLATVARAVQVTVAV